MGIQKRLAAVLAAVFLAAGLAACAAPSSAGEADEADEAVYSASEAYIKDGSMIFTVFAGSTGDYLLDFNGSVGIAAAEVLINGEPPAASPFPRPGTVSLCTRGSTPFNWRTPTL